MAKKEDKEKKEDKIDKSLPLTERRRLSEVQLISSVAKKYGKGSIGVASDMVYRSVPRISSGIFILDYALGGGWPRGRINLIWGDRSSGKSTNMSRMIAVAQNMNAVTNKYLWEGEEKDEDIIPMKVALIDVEGTYDAEWSGKIGVDASSLIYSRPDTLEEAAETIEALLSSGSVDVVVLDSLAAMIPTAESEGEMTDHNVGTAALKNSKMFRKVQSALNKMAKEDKRLTPTLFIINQLRQKIGISFGDPSIKPGGVAQDFYPSVEVKLWGNKVSFFDDEKKLPKSSEFSFRIVKNKVSPPKIEGSYEMALVDDPDGDYVAGSIIESKEVLEFAERLGVLVKESPTSWRMYGDVFSRKGDLVDAYVKDKNRFSLLKRDLLARLCPKQ